MNRAFTFIEAPVYQGQKHRGVSLGPAFLRQLLTDQHFQFETYSLHESQYSGQINDTVYEELSFMVEREYRRQNSMFIAGGDHSLSIGTVQGVLRAAPKTKVVWIDAHADINTQRSSLTQSWHGMPLAFLTGLDRHYLKYDWFEKQLNPKNLIYLGLRDLDTDEKVFLNQLGIQNYSTEDLMSEKKSEILNHVLQAVAGYDVHLSIDSDAFDPLVAPATGVKVQNGLNFEIVEEFVKKMSQISNIRSFEYVELNPMLAVSENDATRTAQLGIDLYKQILKINQSKELTNGINDRIGNRKRPVVHDPYFHLEK